MGMIVSWMLVAAAIGAFAVTALSGCFVIPALHKLHFGQTIRESGPTWHNKKQGTPTMGGLCFIFGILVACGLVYAGFYRYAQDLLGIVQVRAALLALFLAFGSGFIGFLDDYIKVVKHRNLGLLAWQKAYHAVHCYRRLPGGAAHAGPADHHHYAALYRCSRSGLGVLPHCVLRHHLFWSMPST